jgi:hypothetical protein
MSELDPPGGPDPELEAFYSAERARPPVPDAARHAALARVLAAAPAPAPVPGVGRGPAAAAALAMLALGVIIGAAGHAAWVAGDERPAPRIEAPSAPSAPLTAPPPSDEPSPPSIPPPSEVPEAVVVEPEAPATSGRAEAPSEPDDEGLASEMALVARAQTALHRGLFESALSALDEHARRFPRGELAEEREALAVQALARASRGEEARRRADRFEARYPRSLLGPVVRAAVEGAASEPAAPSADGAPR